MFNVDQVASPRFLFYPFKTHGNVTVRHFPIKRVVYVRAF